MCSMEEVAEIGSRPNSIPISCQLHLNLDGLLERIWEMMALVGEQPPTHFRKRARAGVAQGGYNCVWLLSKCGINHAKRTI